MARLRYPGRPGHRYGRSLVRYLPEKDRSRQHIFFARTATIQRNLKWFYDLFGDSDEEDDFQGFTLSETGPLPPPKAPKQEEEYSEADPSLSPKIKNLKASWPIMGRRAGRDEQYAKGEPCAEMQRGEWNTANPYKRKKPRVVDGRIQKLKLVKKRGVDNPKNQSDGRRSYRDMMKGADFVRPALIPAKLPKPKEAKPVKQRPTQVAGKIGGKIGGKISGKIRMGFTLPRPKANNVDKVKIKMAADGNEFKIVRGPGRPRKDAPHPKVQKALQIVSACKAKTNLSVRETTQLKRAQQILQQANAEPKIKYKPWEKKKLMLAQAHAGQPGGVGKLCALKSKQVNMSKAKELVKKARDTQRKNAEVFGSDAPGKRSVKCSSKLADMDMKGVDLQFLHRKLTPPSGSKVRKASTTSRAKKKLHLLGKSVKEPKTPKPKAGFTLPVVSSRSSRVIKPTKRYLEQEEFYATTPSLADESWADMPMSADNSFSSPIKTESPVPEPSSIGGQVQLAEPDKRELSAKKKAKHKKEKGEKKKAKKAVKSESETDLINQQAPSPATASSPREGARRKELAHYSHLMKFGRPLSEAEEEKLLGSTDPLWQPLRAMYKRFVRKETLNEAESLAVRDCPLVAFATLRTGEEVFHIRGRVDGVLSVTEILHKAKLGEALTPAETEKLKRYRLFNVGKRYRQTLMKKDGKPAEHGEKTEQTEKSTAPLDGDQLERERERLVKVFLDEKEVLLKIMEEQAPVTEGLPSLRALMRKDKQGLELTPAEASRLRHNKIVRNKRARLRKFRVLLKETYKDFDANAEKELEEKIGLEEVSLEGSSGGLSPNSKQLLALGIKLHDARKPAGLKKKKKKKLKQGAPFELLKYSEEGEKKMKKKRKLSKAQKIKLKKKKKRKKALEERKKDAKLRKKHASSKLLLKAKQRRQGKGEKISKSAARKLRLGGFVEEEPGDSGSKLRNLLLHDKLLSPSDKSLQDAVSRQMADALEADMSPDQAEISQMNAQQVAHEVTIEGSAPSGGPRIKHVCRRASVALGYSPARYKARSPTARDGSPKLSALPVKERKKLFASDGDSDESDSASGSEEGRRESTSPRLSGRKRKPTFKKRSMSDFITLDNRNYTKYGYEGGISLKRGLKVAKKKKTATAMLMEAAAMSASIPMSEEDANVKRRSRCGQCSACLRKMDCQKCINCLDKPKYGGPGTKKQACMYRKCHNLVKMKLARMRQMRELKKQVLPQEKREAAKPSTAVPKPAGARIKRAGGEAQTSLPLVPQAKPGTTEEKNEKSDAGKVVARTVRFSKRVPGKHFIKTDFKEDYDMSVAWKRGMAIMSSEPMVPRTICYLCGSHGKHEVIYCNVCCEPFHEFCLDEDERPLKDGKENWCCRNCRFCHVCDHQDKLLTCHQCHCSYHAECLGPNYPTKPSKKRKIWVCSRCVKCKSCGATTPGPDPKASWMHGFSHCQECGKLFEKGNYCPVCKKCYEDDDFESKMMQCADCCQWVHAKCENLSDDQYRILTELPDSMPYLCPNCGRDKPSPWKQEVNEELQAGFVNVLNALYGCKSAGHLIWPNRRFKYLRKVQQGDTSRPSTTQDSRDSANSSPAPSEASSLERETPTPDSMRALEASGGGVDGGVSSAQDDVEETYSFRRGRTVRRVLRRRRQQRNAGEREEGSDSGRTKDLGKGDGEVERGNGDTDQSHVAAGESIKSETAEAEETEDKSDKDRQNEKEGVRNEEEAQGRIEEGAEESRAHDAIQLESSNRKTIERTADTGSDVVDPSLIDVEDDALRTKEEDVENKRQIKSMSTNTEGKDDFVGVPDVANVVPKEEPDGSTTASGSSHESPCADTGADGASPRIHLRTDDPLCESNRASPADLPSQPVSSTPPAAQAIKPSSDAPDTQTEDDDECCLRGDAIAMETSGCNEGAPESNPDSALRDSLGEERRLSSAASEPDSVADEVDIDVEGDEGDDKMEVDEQMDSNNAQRSIPKDQSTGVEVRDQPQDASETSPQKTALDKPNQVSFQLDENKERGVAESEDSSLPGRSLLNIDGDIPDSVVEIVTSSSQMELDVKKTPPKVAAESAGKKEEEEDKKEEDMKPTSLQFVKAKMMAGYYKSVEKFCRDCVYIFRASFSQENSRTVGLTKCNQVARLTFTRIMKQMFPWFDVDEPRLWEEGEEIPVYMCQDVVVSLITVEPPHMDHEYAQWRHQAPLPATPSQPSHFKKLPTPRRRHAIIGGDRSTDDAAIPAVDDVSDPRRCCLCGVMGDDEPNNAGRLLYCGQDEWIHINCALWSAEVFEEVDGSLINVHAAISRGRMMRCEVCGNLGATVGCCSRGCPANFHFMCARSRSAMFQEDKKVYCFQHHDKVDKAIMGPESFGVLRRVCVSLANMKPNRTFSQGLEAKSINVMIGSWTLESLGHLGFLSDLEGALLPLDFSCSRVYWSTMDAGRRCVYTLRIVEVNPLASPTTPQDINHTTEHSPGSFPFRKAALEVEDDTDMLTDALMEATKESNEAAMALDQVAALLAGSQTVSEIQNAADALAATSSLFDDEVFNSLNLDENLNSGLDSDGIMDMMDALETMNPETALRDFPGGEEDSKAVDKPLMDDPGEGASTEVDGPDVSAPLTPGETTDESPEPGVPDPVTSLTESAAVTSSVEIDGALDTTVEESTAVLTVEGSTSEPTVEESTSKPTSTVIDNLEASEGEAKQNLEMESPMSSEEPSTSTRTLRSDTAASLSISTEELPVLSHPESPLISPKMVPVLKLVKLPEMADGAVDARTIEDSTTELASKIINSHESSAGEADETHLEAVNSLTISTEQYPEVIRPESPLISPKKVPVLKLVKLPLEDVDKPYLEADDSSSGSASDDAADIPSTERKDSLHDSSSSVNSVSDQTSPVPELVANEPLDYGCLMLPSVSTSPSEKVAFQVEDKSKDAETLHTEKQPNLQGSDRLSDIVTVSSTNEHETPTMLFEDGCEVKEDLCMDNELSATTSGDDLPPAVGDESRENLLAEPTLDDPQLVTDEVASFDQAAKQTQHTAVEQMDNNQQQYPSDSPDMESQDILPQQSLHEDERSRTPECKDQDVALEEETQAKVLLEGKEGGGSDQEFIDEKGNASLESDSQMGATVQVMCQEDAFVPNQEVAETTTDTLDEAGNQELVTVEDTGAEIESETVTNMEDISKEDTCVPSANEWKVEEGATVAEDPETTSVAREDCDHQEVTAVKEISPTTAASSLVVIENTEQEDSDDIDVGQESRSDVEPQSTGMYLVHQIQTPEGGITPAPSSDGNGGNSQESVPDVEVGQSEDYQEPVQLGPLENVPVQSDVISGSIANGKADDDTDGMIEHTDTNQKGIHPMHQRSDLSESNQTTCENVEGHSNVPEDNVLPSPAHPASTSRIEENMSSHVMIADVCEFDGTGVQSSHSIDVEDSREESVGNEGCAPQDVPGRGLVGTCVSEDMDGLVDTESVKEMDDSCSPLPDKLSSMKDASSRLDVVSSDQSEGLPVEAIGLSSSEGNNEAEAKQVASSESSCDAHDVLSTEDPISVSVDTLICDSQVSDRVQTMAEDEQTDTNVPGQVTTVDLLSGDERIGADASGDDAAPQSVPSHSIAKDSLSVADEQNHEVLLDGQLPLQTGPCESDSDDGIPEVVNVESSDGSIASDIRDDTAENHHPASPLSQESPRPLQVNSHEDENSTSEACVVNTDSSNSSSQSEDISVVSKQEANPLGEAEREVPQQELEDTLSPIRDLLSEELRMQGVQEEDILQLAYLSPKKITSNKERGDFKNANEPVRRLSSDPEHESILKQLSSSIASRAARKQDTSGDVEDFVAGKRYSARNVEREPVLAAFASRLRSKSPVAAQDKVTKLNETNHAEEPISPPPDKHMFKKLGSPNFAHVFKAFIDAKKKPVRNLVQELIERDLVKETNQEVDLHNEDSKSSAVLRDFKRRKSNRLSSEESVGDLQNGDDSLLHAEDDEALNHDSPSKLSQSGRKKYPMRTTSSRLQRIADGEMSGENPNEYNVHEDVDDGREPDESLHARRGGIRARRISGTLEHSNLNHHAEQKKPSPVVSSPKSGAARRALLEEKENEVTKRGRGRPRKIVDSVWSPDRGDTGISQIGGDLQDEKIKTRGSRKSSLRMQEIIAAELESEEDIDRNEEIKTAKRGRGRPRKNPPLTDSKFAKESDGSALRDIRERRAQNPAILGDAESEQHGEGENETRKRLRTRSSGSADFKSDEENVPKRKRGRPRKSSVEPAKNVATNKTEEQEGRKRTRADLSSASDEEENSTLVKNMAKKLKDDETTGMTEEWEDPGLSPSKTEALSVERQSHPRKQRVIPRNFPGENTGSKANPSEKPKPSQANGKNGSNRSAIAQNLGKDSCKDEELAGSLSEVGGETVNHDSSPKADATSPSKLVRVTVTVDPITGAISEVVTGATDEESMEVDSEETSEAKELDENPPGHTQQAPHLLGMQEASPMKLSIPTQSPWPYCNSSPIVGLPGVQSGNSSARAPNSNTGRSKMIIGKDLATNEIIYIDTLRKKTPAPVRNPMTGPRFRGPTMPRNVQPTRTFTRGAKTRGPFSRNSQVRWLGNTATLTPTATANQVPPSNNYPGVHLQAGNMQGAMLNQGLGGTSVPMSSGVPGLTGARTVNMMLPNNNQVTYSEMHQPTIITTTLQGASGSIAVVTTTSPATSSAQDHYLSILQRSYQASQMQQNTALAGLRQNSLLQNYGMQQIGVASSACANPLLQGTHPAMLASPTLQTLQAIIQQAGVQSSLGQPAPGVQPLSGALPDYQLNSHNAPLPTNLQGTDVSGLLETLATPSPMLASQPAGPSTPAEAVSGYQDHMYFRNPESTKHRRKSPHQVKVWFDSYGSLKNQDDETEGAENMDEGLPAIPSPVKVPSVRVKNPSNTPRARVKNPTFGAEDSRGNRALLKLNRKRQKSKEGPDAQITPLANNSADLFAGLSADEAFFAALPNLGQSDHHDDSPSLLLTLMEQEKRRGPSTTPRRASNRPHLMFEVRSDDGFETRGETMEEVWGRVVERVGELRTNSRRKHLSFDGVKGMKMLGITHDAIVFLVEQLYGAGNCTNYKFRFHKHEEITEDDEPPINPHGCARAETFKRTSTFDIFNFLASRHRNRPIYSEVDQQDEPDIQHKSARRATSLQDLPMAMRFRHLKQTAKEAVGVYRSSIHGRGLFCRRPIEAGEMVIEYSGTVIRSILTDKREKYYESKGIGCYMFRIDDFNVVDATTHGNAARFINHSCDPNCFSRVIEVGGQKHIIIFASRRIARGEELTYDYKFPIEEVKIPCNCVSRKCRKYLN